MIQKVGKRTQAALAEIITSQQYKIYLVSFSYTDATSVYTLPKYAEAKVYNIYFPKQKCFIVNISL